MSNTQTRVKRLIKFAKEYYALLDGALIDKPDELLRVARIKKTKHTEHPHKDFRVYISRRALKHVVEVRRKELTKHHTESEILLKICFAVEQIPEVIVNFDKYEYEYEPEKHFYMKHYSGEPSIRILCERKDNEKSTLQICSVHFRKPQKEK